jgi:hypothetical protein
MIKVCVLSDKFITTDLFWVSINNKNIKIIEKTEEKTVFKKKK